MPGRRIFGALSAARAVLGGVLAVLVASPRPQKKETTYSHPRPPPPYNSGMGATEAMAGKWRNLLLLAMAELLAMGLWFSASAVVPQLTRVFALDGAGQSWVTMSVQLGFVFGALTSAATNLSDRIPAARLVALSALVGAALNATIALFVTDLVGVLVLRFLTGVALAGVYPPGMKLMATWCREDRGLGIGLLVGALTVGSASPHLLNVLPFIDLSASGAWRSTLLIASAGAVIGAVVAGGLVRPGPYFAKPSAFSWRHATAGLTDRSVRLANFGYLGHMWELYAMWAWVPLFLLESYRRAGWSESSARVSGFLVIAAGSAGSILAGIFADRVGRTTVTIASLAVSGSCCLLAGWFIEAPALATVIALVWGFAVVADSAQFSTAVTELGDARYLGTALTMQTCLGFLLTMITIRLVPPMVEALGWQWAFVPLAAGPVFGIVSMARLRRLPEAVRMAGGHR